jgi:ATP-dependent Lhr-like helicase
MIDLLLEGWCEPPKPDAIHLSTLVHQTLSVIAQLGGASATTVYKILCKEGPFRQVTSHIFADVLRAIGAPEMGLIEQSNSGLLLLGPMGERLVEHYSFFAVFQTPEEYRLVTDGYELGTLPIDNVLFLGMLLIFSGRRWLVQQIHDQEKIIVVQPAKAGVPPTFGGNPGDIHDTVIERMFTLLEGDSRPVYMDAVSLGMLKEARFTYEQMGFHSKSVLGVSEHTSIISTRVGTVKTATLALALKSFGLSVEQYDGFLLVETAAETPSLQATLENIASGDAIDLLSGAGNLMSEKFHSYLSTNLLALDATSSRLAPHLLSDLATKVLSKV